MTVRKVSILSFIMIFNLLCVTVANARTDKMNTIIVKAGSFGLSDTRQTIAGSNATFEEDSSAVFAVEYARRFGENFSFGGELVNYSNDYATFISGEVDTAIATANIKAYFDVGKHFRPFVGAGAGFAVIDVSGPFDGSASGFAMSFSAGVQIPFEHVGIHIEYKYIAANAENETNYGNTAKFDVGGDGVFAGISIHF